MRKRNLLVFLLLTGVACHWFVGAGCLENNCRTRLRPPSYYGITVANGMLGLVSSPEPFEDIPRRVGRTL